MLEESIKKQAEREEQDKKREQEQQEKREHEQRVALYWKHREDTTHPEAECPECIRILQGSTND